MTLYPDTIEMDQKNIGRLLLSLGAMRGDADFKEEELLALAKWAEGVCLEYELLLMVLEGDLLIDLKDGEPKVAEGTEEQRETYRRLRDHAASLGLV